MLSSDFNKPDFVVCAEFAGLTKRIHLFAHESGLFFRPENAAPDWWGGFGETPELSWVLDDLDQDEVERLVAPLVSKKHYYRVFDLPDPRADESRTWRVWWRPDQAWTEMLDKPSDKSGAFFWPRALPYSLESAPGDELQLFFEEEWLDPQSDVREAISWCDLSQQERESRALRWQNGSEEELRRVAEAALQMPDWNLESEDARSLTVVWWGAKPLALGFSSPNEALSSRMQRLIPVLQQHFLSFYDLPNGTRLDWDLPWLPKNERFPRSRRVRLSIDRPSAHQRLEAALFLRDWLTQYAPDLLSDWFPNAT